MLQLRPACEHCNKALPPESMEAMICSYECTFCQTCVAEILADVCPNCGGNFCQRPIRPKTARCDGVGLSHQPASEKLVHKPVDAAAHKIFAAAVKTIPPQSR